MTFQNFAQFLGGLGLFLLGIVFFDEASKKVVSGGIKKAIKNATNSILKTIGIGFGATLLFQGSSAVLLILESFVSAGMIEFSHAAKIILGCNVGSSTIGVILGTLGSKFDLMNVALPALGILVLLYFLLKSDKVKSVLKFVIGLCLIFFGLDLMNTGMGVLAQYADFQTWANYPIILFFVIGLFGTILVQSSSITMVLTLSAANAGIIDYRMGVMLLLGAFIGTTATALLGCLEGGYQKKQVAATQIIFNIMVAISGIILLPGIVRVLEKLPVSKFTGLAIFLIGYKALCVMIMLPFINKYTAWIKKLFPKKDFDFGLHIKGISPTVIDAVFPALDKDLILIYNRVFKHCLNTWNIDEKKLIDMNFNLNSLNKNVRVYSNDELRVQYDEIKEIEQQILIFVTNVRQNIDNRRDLNKLDSYQDSLSNVVYANKYMKDVHKTILRLKDSDNKYLINIYVEFKKILVQLYEYSLKLIEKGYDESFVNKMQNLIDSIKEIVDKKALNPLLDNLNESKKDATIISDTLYVDHYFHLACACLLDALLKFLGTRG